MSRKSQSIERPNEVLQSIWKAQNAEHLSMRMHKNAGRKILRTISNVRCFCGVLFDVSYVTIIAALILTKMIVIVLTIAQQGQCSD